jgi:flagellar basal-body rod protein FlgG
MVRILLRLLVEYIGSKSHSFGRKKLMLGLLEAIRGCLKEEVRLDTITNNLSNSSAPGFKRNTISFHDLLPKVAQPKPLDPSKAINIQPNSQPVSVGQPGLSQTDRNVHPDDASFVRIQTDMSQGSMKFTGNNLDFAIHGTGFFKINTPKGEMYTRKGNFALDSDGYLITQDNYKVMGNGGPINIAGRNFLVDDKGRVLVEGSEVDSLKVVDVSNPGNLVKEEGQCFRALPGDREIPVSGDTKIQQGYLEDSNVNLAQEMVKMIHCMRAFESYQKAIRIIDEIDNKAINVVGRVR